MSFLYSSCVLGLRLELDTNLSIAPFYSSERLRPGPWPLVTSFHYFNNNEAASRGTRDKRRIHGMASDVNLPGRTEKAFSSRNVKIATRELQHSFDPNKQ